MTSKALRQRQATLRDVIPFEKLRLPLVFAIRPRFAMVYHPYQLAPKVGAIYKEVAHVLLHCHLALLLLGVGLPPTAWNSGPRHRVISAKYPEGAVRLVVLEQLEEEEEQWKVVEVDVAGFARRPYTGYLERSAPPLVRQLCLAL